MPGGEGLSHKVGNTITEIVVICGDEVPLLVVEGVADVKCGAASIIVVSQVRWIDAISQE